ncbi:MAG: V-type ATPase subunit [Spirochaetaceae bacterium]|jgi:vacuolar-type H+-ATPase subunit C/Vma6|nr:V-type ATPase subunit [Spirochaetaceae bacterium]
MGAERSFIYAKACGIIARSFVETRLSRLSAIQSLDEFNALVFHNDVDLKNAKVADIEQKVTSQTLKTLLSIINSFPKPPEFIIRLIKNYEYADLKSALAAIRRGDEKMPAHNSLGRFGSVRFSAYPNLNLMVKGTEYVFLLKTNIDAAEDVHAALDKHYYVLLLSALKQLPKKSVPVFRFILGEEIALMNSSWALRLRAYYNLSAEAVSERLIDEELDGKSLARDARACLSFALNHRPEWVSWRRARFLNPEMPKVYWKCDPVYFQNAAAVYLYQLARKNFRRHPFSLDTAACFVRLKQFEEQALNSVAEGISLGVPAAEALKIAGGAL